MSRQLMSRKCTSYEFKWLPDWQWPRDDFITAGEEKTIVIQFRGCIHDEFHGWQLLSSRVWRLLLLLLLLDVDYIWTSFLFLLTPEGILFVSHSGHGRQHCVCMLFSFFPSIWAKMLSSVRSLTIESAPKWTRRCKLTLHVVFPLLNGLEWKDLQ